ncbi:heparan-alpha-glucosaminide N-acetyltransferase domain-containing protein [Microbacterium shaanxiense]
MTSSDQPLAGRRIVGIDIARFVAIIGMMAAHLVVQLGSDPNAGRIDSLAGKLIGATISSTSATTFAVLGGVSLVLLSRSMRDRSRGRMLTSILIRGFAISLIGVLLEILVGPISVVLTAYGVAMIIAAFALLLPSTAVTVIAVVLWLGGGAVNAQVREGIAATPTSAPGPIDEVGRVLRDLLLTGHYPAITWVAYMLTGILLARILFATLTRNALRRLCLRLVFWGLAIYAVITVVGRIARMRPTWFGLPDVGESMLSSGRGAPIGTELWMLIIPTPHSGNPADMLRTVAGACLLIGLFILLFDVRRREHGFAVETVRAAGAAPLTIYTAHVLVTMLLSAVATRAIIAGEATAPVWYAQGVGILLLQIVGVLVIGAVLARLHRRGPLEALLGFVSGTSRPRIAAPRPSRT